MNQTTEQNNLPPKKGFWKKFFSLNNRLFSVLIGLILAGIFCTGAYVLAAYIYNPGDTLDPTSCTSGPSTPNCIAPPATYSFGSNDFTGTGSFTTSGGTISGSTVTDGTLSITGGNLTTTGILHAGTINVGGVYTLPTAAPTSNGQVLTGNTSGATSWSTPSSGGASTADHFVTTASDGDLSNSTNLGALSSGFVKSTVSGGVSTISIDTNTYLTSSTGLLANGTVTGATSQSQVFNHGVTLGAASTTNGSIILNNSTNANTLTLNSGATSTSYTLTLPTAAPTSNGQVLVGNTSGATSWSTPSFLGSFATYAGMTSLTYNGNLGANGYKSGDSDCNVDIPGSHMCSTAEILYTISTNVSSLPFSGTAWINNGPPGYTANANDCSGHRSPDPSFLGAFWDFTGGNSAGGVGYLTNCSVQKKLACCK